MAPIFIADAVSIDVLPAHDVAAAQSPVFASYCPGKLLKESLTRACMVTPPVRDDAAESCFTYTDMPHEELPHLLGFRTCLDADSKTQDHEKSPCAASSELLSIGSLAHARGLCRPCGFVHHKGGCSAGVDCTFCHVCPPGTIEKQRTMRRQRTKVARANRDRQVSSGLTTLTDGSSTPEHDDASQSSTVDTQSRSRPETPPLHADLKKSATFEAAAVPSNEAFGPLLFVNLSCCPLGARSIAPPASRPPQLPHLLSRAPVQPPASAQSVKDCKAECTTSAGSYV